MKENACAMILLIAELFILGLGIENKSGFKKWGGRYRVIENAKIWRKVQRSRKAEEKGNSRDMLNWFLFTHG